MKKGRKNMFQCSCGKPFVIYKTVKVGRNRMRYVKCKCGYHGKM